MARSIKKNNYCKDSGKWSKFQRRQSHSRLRLEVKRRLKRGDWETMPLNRELTNQYSIIDYWWYIDQRKMKEYYDTHQRIDNGWVDDYQFYRIRWSPQVMWYKGQYRLRK